VKFLGSEFIESEPLEIDDFSSAESVVRAIDGYLARYPFLEYAAGNWQFHALTALQWKGNYDLRKDMEDICDVDHPLFRTWFLCFWRVVTQRLSTCGSPLSTWRECGSARKYRPSCPRSGDQVGKVHQRLGVGRPVREPRNFRSSFVLAKQPS
jgi:hypothetical protein